MTEHFNKTSEKARRRQLRNHATEAEKLLWKHLKSRQLDGFKFRRQYSIDGYVVDFYCPEVKLAIELDGDTHFVHGAIEYDRNREAHISSFGITFLRFFNDEVYTNMDGVLQVIFFKVRELKRNLP